ncbi:Hypothetical protein PAS_chr3_0492 [Komagataella phaffii GS115]|uniref:Uncharacterized protein n=1 Tax=Komagataella phaffii (strain GS115 / ATCC 20864) TaxID=644223 RepID=C4R4Q4_KOMPG|nr:Hypothetical protein PAS_chr3_0492 [Komagataella phaffii GS115]CAY70540.1 Hypothetical protein PAS_chr3_0492 [Komagataella phaffii GS115]
MLLRSTQKTLVSFLTSHDAVNDTKAGMQRCLRKFKPRSFDAKLTTGVCLALKQITQSRKKRPACGMLRLLSVHTSGLVLEGYPRVECAPPQLAKRAVRHTKEENSGQVTCLKKV